ncbi:hypothetical protein BBFL7_00626 [Flavobacteria bacterium BBFL7]|nr:hypothetical protein BBFL7_00626 [Flavobacteria bacterium BBFL7]
MKSSILKKFCEFEKKGGVFPLLPAYFIWVGLTVCLLSILGLLLVHFQFENPVDFYKNLFMHFILIGLFIITLSRDKNEDERTLQLRYRAFGFAFVLGTFMLLLMPFAAMILDSINDRTPLEWEQDQSFFFIISSFLFYYLMYFQIFKKQL